jgi:hypothetical protein
VHCAPVCCNHAKGGISRGAELRPAPDDWREASPLKLRLPDSASEAGASCPGTLAYPNRPRRASTRSIRIREHRPESSSDRGLHRGRHRTVRRVSSRVGVAASRRQLADRGRRSDYAVLHRPRRLRLPSGSRCVKQSPCLTARIKDPGFRSPFGDSGGSPPVAVGPSHPDPQRCQSATDPSPYNPRGTT